MSCEQMSDGEIAWRVHHAVSKIPDGCATICTADYCNNPSDAWPIITENHINLSKHKEDDEWFAFVRADGLGVSKFQCKDKNPLRASMICFLKIKDAEKC